MILFPFAEYWPLYVSFVAFVLVMLALDLGVFHRKAHQVAVREALVWSVVWAALALAFNYGFYEFSLWKLGSEPEARRLALEFLAGYIIEKTLSLDNIFVFAVVFEFFAIPAIQQHRVLYYGIIGALGFRAIFIALGSALLHYHWVSWVFGGLLIVTAVKMLFLPEGKMDPESSPVLRFLMRRIPMTPELHGNRFVYARRATPLLLALLFVEVSDILFAIDSVPAIFAITREPLVVFTSNVFAILGLRSLYFLLAAAVSRFSLLKYGLAVVLGFVGLKMVWLNEAFDGKFPVAWSLGVIVGVIALSIVCSVVATRPKS